MPSGTKTFLLAGALIALTAGGGAIWYVYHWPGLGKPVQDAAHNASEQVPPPPPDQAPPDPPVLKFKRDVAPYSLTTNAAVYVAPSRDAPQMYVLPQGTPFLSVGKSVDSNWVLAITRNGVAANIQAKDTGPFDPTVEPKGQPLLPAAGEPISGLAEVVDSATLRVDGQLVFLFGVMEAGSEAADRLRRSFAEKKSANVSCTPVGASYICHYIDGQDIARTELFSGYAKAAPNATIDYLNLEKMAQKANKGIWLKANND